VSSDDGTRWHEKDERTADSGLFSEYLARVMGLSMITTGKMVERDLSWAGRPQRRDLPTAAPLIFLCPFYPQVTTGVPVLR